MRRSALRAAILAAVVCAALPLRTGATPEPRWWRRGRDQAQAAAREASGAAALVLLDLDTVQTVAADGVAMAQALDAGHAGQRLAAAWEPVRERADSAVRAYMTAVSTADLDTDVEEHTAQQAGAAFAGVSAQLSDALTQVRGFLSNHEDALAQARRVHGAVPIRGQAAQSAIAAATAAITAAVAAGFLAREANELLDEARTALRHLTSDVGVRRFLDGAEQVIELAHRATADADSLPGRHRAITQRITAARTFLQATESQLESAPGTLSELRRAYLYSSFADVEHAPSDAAVALTEAGAELDRAATMAGPTEQHFAAAEGAVTEARQLIDQAAAGARSVPQRLAELRAAEHDPPAAVTAARRVLRDAQRYLLVGPEQPSPRHVSRLDALAAQLDGALPRLAARVRPDYWAFLGELRAASAGAAAVVSEVRTARGHHLA